MLSDAFLLLHYSVLHVRVCVCLRLLSWLPPTGLCASSIPSTFVNMGMTGWPTRLSMSRGQRVTDESSDSAPPDRGQVPACRIKEPSLWTKNLLLPAWTVLVRTDWFFFLHFYSTPTSTITLITVLLSNACHNVLYIHFDFLLKGRWTDQHDLLRFV